MNNPTILSRRMPPRRNFDVKSKTDLQIFKQFIDTSGWGHMGCPFICEEPWLSIPDMIKDKIAQEYVKSCKVA